MIPFRDTLDVKGPVWATALFVVVTVVLFAVGEVPHMNFWQMLVAIVGIWIFGAFVERRLGSPAFIAICALLTASSGFLVAAVDQQAGTFEVNLFLPVLLLGALHLALAPKSRIVCLVPVPFAMTFFEIPTVAMLIGWVAVEILLTAA